MFPYRYAHTFLYSAPHFVLPYTFPMETREWREMVPIHRGGRPAACLQLIRTRVKTRRNVESQPPSPHGLILFLRDFPAASGACVVGLHSWRSRSMFPWGSELLCSIALHEQVSRVRVCPLAVLREPSGPWPVGIFRVVYVTLRVGS